MSSRSRSPLERSHSLSLSLPPSFALALTPSLSLSFWLLSRSRSLPSFPPPFLSLAPSLPHSLSLSIYLPPSLPPSPFLPPSLTPSLPPSLALSLRRWRARCAPPTCTHTPEHPHPHPLGNASPPHLGTALLTAGDGLPPPPPLTSPPPPPDAATTSRAPRPALPPFPFAPRAPARLAGRWGCIASP